MRKLFALRSLLLLSIVGFINTKAQAQLLTESFDYTPHATSGLSAQSAGAWNIINTGDSILIQSGSLSYPGLVASMGNSVVYGGAGTDYYRSFASQTSGTVYYSFLLNVSSLGSLNTAGSYTTGFIDGTTSNFIGRVWLRLSGTSNYNIGINAGSVLTNTSWLGTALTPGTTYLVVISHQLISGTSNDVSNIWINPTSLGGSAPAAQATSTNTGAGDATSVQRVFLRQDAATTTPGSLLIDEIRVGTTWASVTPSTSVSPTLTINSSSLTFSSTNINTSSAPQTYTVTGTNLSGPVSITTASPYSISESVGGPYTTSLLIAATDIATAKTIYVQFSPTNAGSFTGTVNNNSTGADQKIIALSGTAVDPNAPVLTVSPGTLNFSSTGAGSASTLIYTLTGANLTNDVTVSVATPYSVSTDNTTFGTSINVLKTDPSLTAGKSIYVRFSPSAGGSFPATVNNFTSGAETKTVTLTGTGVGLINLTISPYSENFDGISTGLPTGISGKTGATSSALGSDVSFNTATALWNNTTGGFKNYASANNEQGSVQNTAADRAFGVRQVTATDPGAAFVFQVANTSGKINFSLDFNLQSLDASSTRTTTWKVDYGFGLNPSTFFVPTTNGILTTGGTTFSNNAIHVDFGNALDNNSSAITIRIVALNGSSGSGNRASTGVDDFMLTWEDPTAKTFSLSTTAINFPVTNVFNSNTSTYTIVNQTNLDHPITIGTTAPYSISTDNTNFGSEILLQPADAINKTMYVKFSPAAVGVYQGAITHSSDGAGTKIINLSGEAIDPSSLSFSFNSCTVSSIPGSGFLSVNVTGAQKWGCSQYGRNSTNGVDVNGFSGGAAQTNDAWMISPALNLNNIVNLPVLSFYSRGEFSGPKLQLYVSTSYSGNGVPNISDWTEITTANFPTPTGSATTTWTLSDNIDLSAYKSAPKIYIAFRYTSSAVLNAARWSVDDIAITDQSTLLNVSPVQLSFGEVSVGSSSASQPVSLRAVGNNDLSISAPEGYQVSTDNSSFTNSILINQAIADAGTIFYVRFSPVVKALKVEGNINASAEGLNKNIVSVTGSSFPKSETFDVACYNISFFGSNSTNNATPEQTATQIANITTVMQRLSMDVIGIEEMSNDAALTQLVSNLPGYASVMSHRWSYSFEPPDPNFPPQKIGFIYNTATMTLSTTEPPRVMFESMYDSARLNLPGHRLADYPTGTPSSFWGSGRLPFLATFNANVDGVAQKIRMVVIHAKSGGDADGYTRRQYDVKVLKDSLDVLYPNDNIIILGDYNDRMVTSIYVGHPSSYLPFVNDNVDYNILTLSLDEAGRTSFPSSNGMIDHITTSNELTNEYISNSVGIEDPRLYIANYNATTGSDHLPVYSRYVFCKLTCPSNITVSNTIGQCGATVNFDVSSTMTCGTVIAVPASGSFFPIGTTTVNVTASSGETCSFTVTVKDEEDPTIITPQSITVNAEAGKCSTARSNISLGTPVFADNCEGAVVINNAPDVFPVGATNVTWTVTDAAGRTTSTSQVVTVVDNQTPTIIAPVDITTAADPGKCFATITGLGTPLTGDNCGVASVTNDAPPTFPVGTTTVTWKVTDVNGNSTTAVQIVTVSDHQNPVITALVTVTVTPNNSSCTAKNLILGQPVTADNCGVQTVSNDAPAIFPLGTTVVTWTVTDIHGNRSSATQSVIVAVNPPLNVTIPDVYAVNPGGEPNTIYLGYGPSSITLNAMVTGGAGSYSYKWTIGSSAGPALNNSSSYTVSPTDASTTYLLNVKDLYGCTVTYATKTVYVADVRCGTKLDRVLVCQQVKNKFTTGCVIQKDVAPLLSAGSYLGSCINPAITGRIYEEPELLASSPLLLNGVPNPSANYFTINIEGGDVSKKISLRIVDIMGRIVEQKNNLTSHTIKIGENYRPGIYIAEVIQGENRKQIKLVKSSR